MTMTQGSTTTREQKLKRIRTLAEYTPLRLNERERSLLAVLESTLSVSEYTDNIDISSRRNKARRILDGLLETCAISTGLAVVANRNEYKFSSGKNGASSKGLLSKITPSVFKKKKSHAGGIGDGGGGGGSKLKKKPPTSANVATESEDDGTSVSVATSVSSSFNGDLMVANGSASVNGRNHRDVDSGESSSLENTSKLINGNNNSGAGCKSRNTSSSSTYTVANIARRSPEDNAEFFQEIFEIGRRNKVLNPAKMRSTYGKLMYMLQDSQSSNVAKGLGFSMHKEMLMVASFLVDELEIEELLYDDRLVDATMYISDVDENTGLKISREVVQDLVHLKQEATNALVEEYARKASSFYGDEKVHLDRCTEEVSRSISSLADAVAVIETSVAPIRRMILFLETNFDKTKSEKEFSLTLSATSYISQARSALSSYSYTGMNRFGFGGSGDSSGPTLSHSHPTQYMFVWQSLKLWCKVQENMHKLWVCADEDLLSTQHGYQLWNTGQGLNRVQSCPRVSRVMHELLSQTKQETGAWVGLSVVHLGDRDVPNALIFIDKYTQIPRFLQPIVKFIDSIPELCSDENIAAYVSNEFGSERNLKMQVLSDYFKHGFDGSGDDGGSCIDGRLTSSWNWTSRIAKQKYYNILMMSGFQGFDGDFK